jgi:glycosyltransferase involved in cell wall biosynthesis
VGDVPAWAAAAMTLIDQRRASSAAWLARRDAGLARARLYSWPAHADRLVAIYREVLSRPALSPPR